MNWVEKIDQVYALASGRALYWHHNVTRHYYGRFAVWFTGVLSMFQVGKRLTHESTFEVVWTVVPSLVLILLAIPSLKLLYSLDFILYDYEPIVTIKVIGHQWFWSYEYVVFSDIYLDYESINFDSYLVGDEDVRPGCLRLLEVDNPLLLPTNTYIRFLVTAVDVLHSWAVGTP